MTTLFSFFEISLSLCMVQVSSLLIMTIVAKRGLTICPNYCKVRQSKKIIYICPDKFLNIPLRLSDLIVVVKTFSYLIFFSQMN